MWHVMPYLLCAINPSLCYLHKSFQSSKEVLELQVRECCSLVHFEKQSVINEIDNLSVQIVTNSHWLH